jgi:hypothetical protein
MVNCSSSGKIINNYKHLLLIFDVTNIVGVMLLGLVPSRSKVIW